MNTEKTNQKKQNNMETLKEAFNEKYPAYSKRILEKFEKVNKCEANWENITKPNLAKFVNSLQKDVARSSARTYCAMFKAVLNLYSDVVEFPRGFGDILTVKSDVSENVYLTEEEVQKIIDYEPENDTERAVRNQFILGCLTCARMSDYVTFTRENIFNDKLRYVSKKTRIKTELPLSPVVKRIIQENEFYGFVGLEYSNPWFNKTIQEICRKIGLDEEIKVYQGGKYIKGKKYTFIGSHTSRRTGITNLYLRGVDIYLISKLAGHSNIKQTEGYICCGISNISEKAIEYFNSFK